MVACYFKSALHPHFFCAQGIEIPLLTKVSFPQILVINYFISIFPRHCHNNRRHDDTNKITHDSS